MYHLQELLTRIWKMEQPSRRTAGTTPEAARGVGVGFTELVALLTWNGWTSKSQTNVSLPDYAHDPGYCLPRMEDTMTGDTIRHWKVGRGREVDGLLKPTSILYTSGCGCVLCCWGIHLHLERRKREGER